MRHSSTIRGTLLACSLLAATPAVAQAPARPDMPARIDDKIASWASQLKAEAEALRSEGAEQVVKSLDGMTKLEAALLDQLRTGAKVDDLLPEIARRWANEADQLGQLAENMPAIVSAHRQRLQNLRGLLPQAQAEARRLEQDTEVRRRDLEALRALARSAAPGSPEAMKAELEAAAAAATLTARDAQVRLTKSFVAQAGQAIQRLNDASQGIDLLSTAISAHAKVLSASADLARTRLVARDALQLLADMADRLEGMDGVLQGLSQQWDTLDGLLRQLGDLPSMPGRVGS